jgi:YD repeat-containing protein
MTRRAHPNPSFLRAHAAAKPRIAQLGNVRSGHAPEFDGGLSTPVGPNSGAPRLALARAQGCASRGHPHLYSTLITSALLCGSFLSTPARSQVAFDPGPRRYQLDARHVDRVSGTVNFITTDMQLGPAGPGGLTLMSLNGRANSIARAGGTNWENLAITTSGTTYLVGTGFTTSPFSKSGTTYTSLNGDGSTLTQSGSVYTYTDPVGVKTVYDYTDHANSDSNLVARATSVTFPTGEKNTLVWQTATYCSVNGDPPCTGVLITRVRLQSVSSSQGYQLHYHYLTSINPPPTVVSGTNWGTLASVFGVNTTLDYCDPTAGTCSTPNQVVPTTIYSYAIDPSGTGTDYTVVDPVGRVTLYALGSGVFGVKTPMSVSGSDIVYTTDTSSRLTQVVWRGLTYGYTNTISGNINTVVSTDPLGHATTTTADMSIGQIKSSQDALSHTTSFTYDAGGNLLTATMPDGNFVTYTLDGRGNAKTTTYTAKVGSGLANIVTSAVYPTSCTNVVTCNKPTSVTDANLHTTSYTKSR